MSLSEFIVAHGWQLVAMGFLVLCSAFFSGSETALFSLSPAELLRFRRDDRRVGRLVASLMRNPRRLLMAILLGNELVNVAFFAISAVMVLELRGEVGRWLDALLLLLPLIAIILLGEVCPKNLAVVTPGTIARLSAVPLSLLVWLLGPVQRSLNVWLIGPLTRLLAPARPVTTALTPAELTSLLELSKRRGMLSADQSTWLQEVIGLSRIRVADIMVPRVDVVAYDIDASPDGLVDLFRKTSLVRIPVCRGDLDDPLGVVHAKDLLLARARELGSLVRPVPYVPEAGTVDKLLQQFRRMKTQMAIVVDEYGGTAGLVTLEDVLEEIVGEIAAPDEEAVEPVRRVGPREYLLDGNLAIHEWSGVFGVDLQVRRVSTIGGLVMSLLDRVPNVGDVATYGNLEFTVQSMHRRRIQQVRLVLGEQRP